MKKFKKKVENIGKSRMKRLEEEKNKPYGCP